MYVPTHTKVMFTLYETRSSYDIDSCYENTFRDEVKDKNRKLLILHLSSFRFIPRKAITDDGNF